jgi:hypothetical protein
MPTVLFKNGWRFFFFANEGDEPIHIHVVKADKSCKFFLNEKDIELSLSSKRNMIGKDLKEVKEIIFENFNYIIESWKKFHKEK